VSQPGNKRAKRTILRLLLNVESGVSTLGDNHEVSTSEVIEIIALAMDRTSYSNTYDLLRVLRANGLAKSRRVGHIVMWRITAKGTRKALGGNY
jgi:DNA-binding PadR family transcriptional regulator